MEKEQEEVELAAQRFNIEHAWNELILPMVAEDKRDRAGEILQETFTAYSEDGRYYHVLGHIAGCLEALKPYEDRADYHKLFLALLWHDVVYKTDADTAPLNEEKSAEAAAGYMQELGIEGGDDVARLIISTKEHKTDKEDEQLVCSIDVITLAEPYHAYIAYGKAIRKEYGWVPHYLYARARPDILKGLISGDGPFQHPDFLYLNERAKANVQREINQLTSNDS